MFSRKIFHKFVVLVSLLLSVLILMGQGCSPGLRPFSKSMSSLSSTTMSGNFDTDYKTGVQLYNTNCMQCHGAVEATNKPKASVPTISAAINNISMMTQLKFLTNTQIQLISDLTGQNWSRLCDIVGLQKEQVWVERNIVRKILFNI